MEYKKVTQSDQKLQPYLDAVDEIHKISDEYMLMHKLLSKTQIREHYKNLIKNQLQEIYKLTSYDFVVALINDIEKKEERIKIAFKFDELKNLCEDVSVNFWNLKKFLTDSKYKNFLKGRTIRSKYIIKNSEQT